MKAVVVYFSKFGNTRQVAEAVAHALAAKGAAQVIDLDNLSPADVNDADLVVMGCPTHRGGLPEAVRPLLQGLPRKLLRGKAVAAFDTSYEVSGFLSHFTAGRRMNGKLRKLGGKPVVPPETFVVTGREGPLAEGELERAQTWAASLLDHVAVPATA